MPKLRRVQFLLFAVVLACNGATILGADEAKSDDKSPINPQVPPEPSPTKFPWPTKKTTTTSTTPSTTSTSTTSTPPTTEPPTTPPPTTEPPTTPPTPTPKPGPTTTPKPEPPKPPQPGTWSVSNDTTSCIILKMAASIEVFFMKDNVTTNSTVNLPTNATAVGSCGNDTQSIQLSWANANASNPADGFSINFKLNGSKFEVDRMSLVVVLDDRFNNSNIVLNLQHVEEEFETPIKMSYKCDKKQFLNFTTQNNTVATVTVSDLQFEAFAAKKDQTFADAKDCEPYETPDIVPIAVGCALIALIVFVLIGYLIGRRRNQARGYLSM